MSCEQWLLWQSTLTCVTWHKNLLCEFEFIFLVAFLMNDPIILIFYCGICAQMKHLGDSCLHSCCPCIPAISPVGKSAFSAFGPYVGLWVSEKVPVVVARTVNEMCTSKNYDYVVTPTPEVRHWSQCIISSARCALRHHPDPITSGAQLTLPHLRGT